MNIQNIFLDRDGTIIADKHYLHRPEEVELLPGAAQTLRQWQKNGLRLFLVTNQSGIGRGYFEARDYLHVHNRLCELLKVFDVHFTDALFCPHAPDEHCRCRKPADGMWQALRARHGLKAEETLMIGDKKADIVFAQNCQFAFSALVLTGHGKKEAQKMGIAPTPASFKTSEAGRPDIVANDLAALRTIIKEKA